jgi:acyl-CoA-dependent ceramide synthase
MYFTNSLQTSKTLNYLDSIIVGPYFALFACIWIYLRHYINLTILWATLTEFRTVGPFELDWETQQYKCWISQYITFALLACLQAVNLFWLYLILRIAKNFVFNKTATDVRSDDEESDEEELNEEATKLLQNDTGMKTDSPVVMINGKPLGAPVEAKAAGIKRRTRKK